MSAGFTSLTSPVAPYGASDAALGAAPSSASRLRDPVDPATFVNAYTRPLPSYAETFSGPGYETRPVPTSGTAVAALICGIAGVFFLVPALGAIVLGHVGLVRTSRNSRTGRGLAIGGLVLGYGVAVLIALVMVAFWVADS